MSRRCQETVPGVEVKVDVSKIVKYCCVATVCIFGIVFGTRTWIKQLELGKRK
ncbi:MAG: hypothetical protein PWP24_1370 [Clostridiales bacterium]|nr:hypothetical protein [Clostridiales bacterium]